MSLVSNIHTIIVHSQQGSDLLSFVILLLGGSGGVVNSLDFCPASLKSLGYFYFRHILSSQWKAVTVNLPTLKAYLEACSHNVSGNKQ